MARRDAEGTWTPRVMPVIQLHDDPARDAVDSFGEDGRVAGEHGLFANEFDLFLDPHQLGGHELQFIGGLASAGEAMLQDLELALEAVAQLGRDRLIRELLLQAGDTYGKILV